MIRIYLCLIYFIALLYAKEKANLGVIRNFGYYLDFNKGILTELRLSAMDALDLVKEKYATNFERVFYSDIEYYNIKRGIEYYYKLADAEYYLVFEDYIGTEQEYLIHLYEFVIDEPDSGIGHTVTYGWYKVDSRTGEIEVIK